MLLATRRHSEELYLCRWVVGSTAGVGVVDSDSTGPRFDSEYGPAVVCSLKANNQRFGVVQLKELTQTNHLHDVQSHFSHQWFTQKVGLT